MIDGVAVFGGSFNPPGLHHRRVVEQLVTMFRQVLIVPCGLRHDKETTNHIDPVHRAAMVDLTFGDMPNVEILHFDLEQDQFTPTVELDRLLASYGTLWHVIGSDLIEGHVRGVAPLQQWKTADAIWQNLRFVVLEREGYTLDQADLPPQHLLLRGYHGASNDLRRLLFNAQPIDGLVVPRVAQYVQRYHPYQGRQTHALPVYQLDHPKISIVVDDYNQRAMASAAALRAMVTVDDRDPDLILVLGGDGTMLRAIRQHHRRRIPFLGVNYGTVGYLLNDYVNGFTAADLSGSPIVRHSPLLYVESTDVEGQVNRDLAFNDAYLVAEPGHAGWIEVDLDGQIVLPKLVADGALVSTAAGSSSYARAMGATPIAIGTPSLVLAGSNVFLPVGWRSAQLPIDTVITMRNIDPSPDYTKRPLYGFHDGIAQGKLRQMTVRTSRVAAVELVFLPDNDPRQKLTRMQFPVM